MRATQQGFSLLELLIAGAILVIILGLVATGIGSGANAVDTLVSETDLTQDTRVAGQLIADELARATYVYPPGAALSLNSRGSFTTRNPRTNSNIWQVGSDPILALLQSPENIEQDCERDTPAGCIYFVAYYPIKRSVYLANSSFGRYLSDVRNEDAHVLMEYRKRLDLRELEPAESVPLEITRGQGRLLADFIAPDGFTVPRADMVCQVHNQPDVRSEHCIVLESDYKGIPEDTLTSGTFDLMARYVRRRGVATTPRVSYMIAKRNLRVRSRRP